MAILFWAELASTALDKSAVQQWTGVLALLVFVCLVTLVRRNLLKTSYSLLWFAGWCVLTLLILQPTLMDQLGQVLGIHYSPTLLLLGVCLALGGILLHVTMVLTRLSRQVNRLAQEIALLKESDSGSCGD